jgi:hypothetical protein
MALFFNKILPHYLWVVRVTVLAFGAEKDFGTTWVWEDFLTGGGTNWTAALASSIVAILSNN